MNERVYGRSDAYDQMQMEAVIGGPKYDRDIRKPLQRTLSAINRGERTVKDEELMILRDKLRVAVNEESMLARNFAIAAGISLIFAVLNRKKPSSKFLTGVAGAFFIGGVRRSMDMTRFSKAKMAAQGAIMDSESLAATGNNRDEIKSDGIISTLAKIV